MPTSKDVFSRHQHFLEQYSNGQVKLLNPFLQRVVADLRLELLKTNTVISEARISAKLKLVEEIMKGNMDAFVDQFTENAKELAIAEGGFAQSTLAQGAVINTTLPSDRQLWAAVNARPFNNRLLKDVLAEFSSDQAKFVRGAVSTGFYEGKTTPEIIRQIVGTRSQQYRNGILEMTRRNAETMVRTSLNHTASVARESFYEDNADLIPYYEWVSTLDGRTSTICKSLDGNVYKVGKGRLPPAHHNCRSTTSPLFEEDVNPKTMKKRKLGGRRASMNGQVSADLNYNDWLKTQSNKFQDETLGIAKAKLFRDGGLTMDKFVNNADQTLTLEQLKQTYPTAWEKAITNPVD